MYTKKIISILGVIFVLGISAYPVMGDMGKDSDAGGNSGEMGSGSGGRSMDSRSGVMDPDDKGKTPAAQNRITKSLSFDSMNRTSTGTMDNGGVKMELEPTSFNDGVFRVQFNANTHTVNLGRYDLMELMHLELEDVGYRPVSAERMSGHHAGGEVEFHVLTLPEHFRIIIRGIPNMEERIFEW